ncbi:hypothetical protein BU16DRAFT_528928 [Lophium mytilinum]|uniref:Uncharacterized protein n=1 Tax=Lophium mytilinum TaxID=390894 RepID=A0A6A6QK22_9PEZI|nr:hypothetical protein BU16DRAFT_528928 [Lophium mytilinum]
MVLHDSCLRWNANELFHAERNRIEKKWDGTFKKGWGGSEISKVLRSGDKTMPYGCRHGHLPVSILHSCRKFHDEDTDILCGENTFALASHDPWGLRHFSQLSHRTLAAIRFLHVFVMHSRVAISSISGKHCDYFRRCERMWQDACALLSMRCTPFQLDLGVECYVKDLRTAKVVSASLQRLQRVRNLRLKLGNHRNFPESSKEEMWRLLKSTVENLTRTSPTIHTNKRVSDASFPFLKLPVEVQLRVLSHTGLVFTNGVEKFHNISTDARGIRLAGFGMTEAMPNGCCWACNTSMPCCKCICNRGKLVQYSSTCVCNRNAAALFTISRHISDLAVETFHSRYKFYISARSVKRIWEAFTKIPPHHLCHMRFLLIDGYDSPEEADYGQWLLLISNIQNHGRFDLHIKIIFTYAFIWSQPLPTFCAALASPKFSRVSVLSTKYREIHEIMMDGTDLDYDDGRPSDPYQGRRQDYKNRDNFDLEFFDMKWGIWREAVIETIYGPPMTIDWNL